MKRVKITLSMVALVAVIGAALAFKAKDGNRTFYSCNSETGHCDVPVNIPSTTTASTAPGIFTQLSTSPATAQGCCPLIKLTTSA